MKMKERGKNKTRNNQRNQLNDFIFNIIGDELLLNFGTKFQR